MSPPEPTVTHHGVMMKVAETGLLITGHPGIGKSSFALALLKLGHQLIADDVVELTRHNQHVFGHCPETLSGLLHTRELGLLDISRIFGEEAILSQHSLDVIVHLHLSHDHESSLQPTVSETELLGVKIPTLHLSLQSACSLSDRLMIWLANRPYQQQTEQELRRRQQQMMQQ